MKGNCVGCNIEKDVYPTGQRDGKLYGICEECKILESEYNG